MTIIEVLNRLRSDIQIWTANNLKTKVNIDDLSTSVITGTITAENFLLGTETSSSNIIDLINGVKNIANTNSSAISALQTNITDNYATQSWVNGNYLSLTGNATSASKLQTARTLWGQSFDGTGNVSGALSGVTDINSAIHIKPDGNVAIGTDTDIVYKLYVNGHIAGHNIFSHNGRIILFGADELGINDGSYTTILDNNYQFGGLKIQHSSIGADDINYVDVVFFSQDGNTEFYGNITASGEVTAPTFNGNLNGSASKVNGYSVSVVTELPEEPDANTIYYVTD